MQNKGQKANWVPRGHGGKNKGKDQTSGRVESLDSLPLANQRASNTKHQKRKQNQIKNLLGRRSCVQNPAKHALAIVQGRSAPDKTTPSRAQSDHTKKRREAPVVHGGEDRLFARARARNAKNGHHTQDGSQREPSMAREAHMPLWAPSN